MAKTFRVLMALALLVSLMAVAAPAVGAEGPLTVAITAPAQTVYPAPGTTVSVTCKVTNSGVGTLGDLRITVGPAAAPVVQVTRTNLLFQTGDTTVAVSVQIPAAAADGVYDLLAEVKTSQQTWAEAASDLAEDLVVVDTTAPSVAVNPVSWAKPGTVFTGVAADATSGVDKVEVAFQDVGTGKFWDGSAFNGAAATWFAATNKAGAGQPAWASWEYNSSTVGFVSGSSYRVQARATDKVAKIALSAPVQFGVDTTLPTVAITSPAAGNITDPVTFAGTAADEGGSLLAAVQVQLKSGSYYWNGSHWVLAESWVNATLAGTNWTLPVPVLQHGQSYALSAKSRDGAGNESALAGPVNFTYYKTTAPTVSVSPLEDYYKTAPTSFSGTATAVNPATIQSVKVTIADQTAAKYWDGAKWVVTQTLLTATGTDSWSYNAQGITYDNQHTYVVTAIATDSFGKTGQASDSFTIDLTAPTVTLVDLPQYVNSQPVSLSGTAADLGSGVDKVQYGYATCGGEVNTWYNATLSEDGTWTATLSGLTEGQCYIVAVKAVDKVGNESTAVSDSFTLKQRPTVTINDIADAVNGLNAVSGTASDVTPGFVVGVQVLIQKGNTYWNGSSWVATESWLNATGTTSWSYNTSAVAFTDGAYTVKARAQDNEGLWSEVVSESFTFDATAPAVWIAQVPSPSRPTQFVGTADSSAASVQVRVYEFGTQPGTWQLATWNGTEWSYGAAGLSDGKVYVVEARGVDALGNATEPPASITFTYGAPVMDSFSIRLYPGWNLVSTPLIPANADIAEVVAGLVPGEALINVDTWLWDGASGTILPVRYEPAHGIGTLTEFVDGQGYWVKVGGNAWLTLQGRYLPEPPAVPPTYDVHAGWNLIGYTTAGEEESIAAGAYLGSMADYAEVMYAYNAQSRRYELVTYYDELQPGAGYWLALTQDGTIVPGGFKAPDVR